MSNPFTLSFYGIASKDSGAHASSSRPYVTSPFLSPYALAAIRAIMAIYCFTTLILGYSWLAHHTMSTTLTDVKFMHYLWTYGVKFIGQSFSYFTFLTFWSLSFYFAISAFHTFDYAHSRARQGQPSELWLQRSFSSHWSFELAYSLWHTTVTTYPFVVSVIFWGTMYGNPWPTDRFAQWMQLSVHGLNSVFTACEIFSSAVGPPKFIGHLLILAVIMSIYLGLAYLSKATADFYPYAWMDPKFGKISIVAHVFAYAGALVAIYSLVWGLKWMKVRYVARKKSSNIRASASGGTTISIRSETSASSENISESDEKQNDVVLQIQPLEPLYFRPRSGDSGVV